MDEAIEALRDAREMHVLALARIDAALEALGCVAGREVLRQPGVRPVAPPPPHTPPGDDSALELSAASRAYLVRHSLLRGGGLALGGSGSPPAAAAHLSRRDAPVLDADAIRRQPKLA